MECPCKDCTKRSVTVGYNCHSHCIDYDEYKAELAEKSKPERDDIYASYINKAIYKRRKIKNEKNRV